MNDRRKPPPPTAQRDEDEKTKRRAAALRANLVRRKVRQNARGAAADAPEEQG